MIKNKILIGKVVHKRLSPIRHKLSYSVFALMLDCDDFDNLSKKTNLLSYNKFNLFSIYDKDHGNGGPIKDFLEEIKNNVITKKPVVRFSMIAYPRVFGYVFNPITVYLGYNKEKQIELVIYEVNNTFGQRVIYVIPTALKTGEIIYQKCDKKLFISPFNDGDGMYTFHIRNNSNLFQIGINLHARGQPILIAHFTGEKLEYTNYNLIKSLTKNLFLTLKVILAIHYEALKLFFKGMSFKKKPEAPKLQICYIKNNDIN